MSVFLYYAFSLSLSQTAPDKDTYGQNEKYYMHEVLHALIWKKKDLTIRNWFLCSTTILFERLKLFLFCELKEADNKINSCWHRK